jgi:UDP-GlcNAc:undecaprenyl-phosphate/decaprenyl-phosphate GlcNAc-1-phosphate transferase
MLVAYAVVFCLAFTAAVLSAPAVRLLAVRIGAVDRPDGKRKIHSKPMPRLGGLVITVAVLAAPAVYLLLAPRSGDNGLSLAFSWKLAGFAAGFLTILALGIVDDITGVRPRVKIIFQTAAVIAVFAAGFRAELPFFDRDSLWLSFPITWFWFVACINAMNLVDGMDGLAGGVAFFVGAVIFALAALYSKIAVALVAAAFLGSVVGFLMYNFHPAVMFLGDSGSMLLGYMIATLAVAGSLRSHAMVAMLIPILALGVPIMDTLLAILRRWSRRLPISQADREHIHHKLLSMGLSHREAVIVLYSACLALASGALAVASRNDIMVGITLGTLCIAGVAAVRIIGANELAALFKRLGESLRANREERVAAAEKKAIFWLRQAESLDDVRSAMVSYVDSLNAATAVVHLGGPSSEALFEARGARVGEAGQGSSEAMSVPYSPGREAFLVVRGRGCETVAFSAEFRSVFTAALAGISQQGHEAKAPPGGTEARGTAGRAVNLVDPSGGWR